MANEITMTAGLAASKNGALINPGTQTKQQTMAGDDMLQQTVSVITTAGGQQLTWGSITSVPACVMIKNLDTVNFVTVAGQTGFTDVFQLKILAGQTALFQPLSADLWIIADTDPVICLVCAVEA